VVSDRYDDQFAEDSHATWVRGLGERPTTEQPSVDTRAFEPVDRRPRASVMATLSLMFGLVSALAVLSGMLVAPGVALGVVAAVLAFGGLSATGRRHVAGRGDAVLGLLLGLGAVVVGVLSLTGVLSWLTPGTNQVSALYEWLRAHASWSLLH